MPLIQIVAFFALMSLGFTSALLVGTPVFGSPVTRYSFALGSNGTFAGAGGGEPCARLRGAAAAFCCCRYASRKDSLGVRD